MFSSKKSLEERKEESKQILEKYSDRIPIIITIGPKSAIKPMKKNKFLAPKNISLGQFAATIRTRINLKPSEALFLFINDTLPAMNDTIIRLYDMHKNIDGFLYVNITEESTFGSN
jgi:GABA(A) receptor-associated protein